MRVTDHATGVEGRQFYLGILERNGGAEIRYAKALEDSHFQPEFGPAIHLLSDLNMVLWGFPNDPKIKRLFALVDNASLRDLLQKHWERLRLPEGFDLFKVETAVVKYSPQRRCTLRHVLQLRHIETRDTTDLVIYSKTYDRKTPAGPFFRILESLWNSPVCQSGELLFPEPLFLERELNTVFQRGLLGRNVDDMLHEIDLDHFSVAAGRALAGLHQTSVDNLECRSIQYEIFECVKITKMLSESPHAAGLAAILSGLRERSESLPPLSPTSIHGAFRLTQLLIVEGKLALIDFDGFLRGNPISDAGSFVANLLYQPMKGLITESQSRSAIHHFCRTYRQAAPWGLPPDALRWYTSAYLAGREIRKCHDKSIKISKRDYEGMIGELLELAAAILQGKIDLA